jgi:hypothetical protein
VVRTAIGAGPRRLPVVPWLLVLLSVLTIIPVGQALVELIVRPVTVGQLVDRRVGLETQLVAVDGLALLVSLEAEPPPDAPDANLVYHWYTVRDSLQEQRLVLVRSVIAPDSLRTRGVVARVVEDPTAIERTTSGIAAQGGSQPEQEVGPLLLVEEPPRNRPVTDLSSLTDLDESEVGNLVRVRLRFADGIATCVGRGDCNARALADGTGSWDNLARDDEGRGVVVRTRYPPSVAPFVGVGHHAQDRETVGRLLALPDRQRPLRLGPRAPGGPRRARPGAADRPSLAWADRLHGARGAAPHRDAAPVPALPTPRALRPARAGPQRRAIGALSGDRADHTAERLAVRDRGPVAELAAIRRGAPSCASRSTAGGSPSSSRATSAAWVGLSWATCSRFAPIARH